MVPSRYTSSVLSDGMHVVRIGDGLNDPVYSVLVCSTLLLSVRKIFDVLRRAHCFVLFGESSLLPDDFGRAVRNLQSCQEPDSHCTVRCTLESVCRRCGIQSSRSSSGLGNSMSIWCVREGGGAGVVGQGGRKGQGLAEGRVLLLAVDGRCRVNGAGDQSVLRAR